MDNVSHISAKKKQKDEELIATITLIGSFTLIAIILMVFVAKSRNLPVPEETVNKVLCLGITQEQLEAMVMTKLSMNWFVDGVHIKLVKEEA